MQNLSNTNLTDTELIATLNDGNEDDADIQIHCTACSDTGLSDDQWTFVYGSDWSITDVLCPECQKNREVHGAY